MRAIFSHWRLHWLLLLLPVALFLPAQPIDETRYLAVAWEMFQHQDLLVLHLNDAPYSDKGPLLFWLIDLAWSIFGVHIWIVRLGVLVVSLTSLILFERIAQRLHPNPQFAQRAALILCGILYFSLFSSAIMFDVLLTTCVLLALHGLLDLDIGRWRRGTGVIAIGLGLGILTKGPVVLLHVGVVCLLAPWWSVTARENKARWYGRVLLGVLGGALIALAWAIPAAIQGGPDYAHSIFLGQTVNRVANSFAHQRPVWWYFLVLPLMLLPWTLSVRAPWATWREAVSANKTACFAMAWFAPTFIAFCFISGKQPHYLLPLLPGIALYLAQVLGSGTTRVRGGPFGVLLVILGLSLCVIQFFALQATRPEWLVRNETLATSFGVIANVWPLWGIGLALLGLFLLMHPRARKTVRGVSLTSVAAVTLGMLALSQGYAPRIDVGTAAARIRLAQERGQPIAHLGPHHGLFEFAGRLTSPLERLEYTNLSPWCAAHPDGEIVTFYKKYPIGAKPIMEMPFQLRSIRFWRAADICSAPRSSEMIPDEDDASDD